MCVATCCPSHVAHSKQVRGQDVLPRVLDAVQVAVVLCGAWCVLFDISRAPQNQGHFGAIG
jgi:hypothetical protein